jgi:hypothetical protein
LKRIFEKHPTADAFFYERDKKMKKFFKGFYVTKKWTKAFFISHMTGWMLANLQTIWIVYVMKKEHRKIESTIKEQTKNE